jgi:hypothetical protein
VAGKKYERQKKTAADSAPKLGQKGQKSGRKKMLETNACLFEKKGEEDDGYTLTTVSFFKNNLVVSMTPLKSP